MLGYSQNSTMHPAACRATMKLALCILRSIEPSCKWCHASYGFRSFLVNDYYASSSRCTYLSGASRSYHGESSCLVGLTHASKDINTPFSSTEIGPELFNPSNSKSLSTGFIYLPIKTRCVSPSQSLSPFSPPSPPPLPHLLRSLSWTMMSR
jgi:hypothetical protein